MNGQEEPAAAAGTCRTCVAWGAKDGGIAKAPCLLIGKESGGLARPSIRADGNALDAAPGEVLTNVHFETPANFGCTLHHAARPCQLG